MEQPDRWAALGDRRRAAGPQSGPGLPPVGIFARNRRTIVQRADDSSISRPPPLVHNFSSQSEDSDTTIILPDPDVTHLSAMPATITRSTLLEAIQSVMGDEKVSSEMRAFCELCELQYLAPLQSMTKDQLLTLSDNCEKAIAQCECYKYHSKHALTLTLGGQRVQYTEETSKSLATTSRNSAASNMVRLCPAPRTISFNQSD